MSRKHFPNKGDNSPLLLIMSIILLIGAIFSFFSFFLEGKKKKNLGEDEEVGKQNPKDFI